MKQSRKPASNNSDFVSSEEKAKSSETKKLPKTENFAKSKKSGNSEKIEIVEKIVRLARKERLTYDDFIYVCQQARKKLGLKKPRKEKRLPQILSESELKKFFQVISDCGNLQHEIMLKLLFFTAVRVGELVKIKVSDIDFNQCKIFIEEGKGRKDRYILFPNNFRLVLQSHLRANPKNKYLFETTRYTCFTPRRVQQIVKEYREIAEISQKVHPHLFRHQMITYLTSQGLSDSQIQLISGHESKKSLEIYQHLSLKNVEQAYQDAVKSLGID
ncbi:tyrosine-type recombinase/integrase [Planktothrix sp. FACHB-1355]|uniref:tyrosine-type recombinase/integrase n=1 Tax=Planktothrix sp. FACHB-1355 TaxID=2692854 RepID=UPI00168AE346|nr:tyrosine-type recombinase/integrase [Planktothrix sp. FACHB-1355]MBD3557520.1 tyrosine-type recombinase/integrase [Planktothrix sp. FACHB-1355]MBD3885878.1 tyrosine-type recombinase/integrase [Phormidium tenue FACHB-886]